MTKETPLISCVNGVFTIPDGVLASLEAASGNGVIYFRQDEETVTLSPTPIAGAKRRHLRPRFRAEIFRTATRLRAMKMADTIRLMAVEFRPHRPR